MERLWCLWNSDMRLRPVASYENHYVYNLQVPSCSGDCIPLICLPICVSVSMFHRPESLLVGSMTHFTFLTIAYTMYVPNDITKMVAINMVYIGTTWIMLYQVLLQMKIRDGFRSIRFHDSCLSPYGPKLCPSNMFKVLRQHIVLVDHP